MSILLSFLALLLGYLLGSVSVAVVLTKLLYGGDVREQGSGNAGATNVARVFGFSAGLWTLLGDVCKTLLSMWLGKLLLGDLGTALAALGCILGHCWPLYFGFRGGKAVSVGAAIALFLDWRLILLLVAVFFAVFLLFKRVSLSSIACAVSYPVWMLILRGFAWFEILLSFVIMVLVIFKHRDNIRRLMNGTEPKFKVEKK